jgi:hypothetical protein
VITRKGTTIIPSAKSALFAFNLPSEVALAMPTGRTAGAYDAEQQIWVGDAAANVAWVKKNLQCGQRFGPSYSGGGLYEVFYYLFDCRYWFDRAKAAGCRGVTRCAAKPYGFLLEICCPN